MAQNKRRPSPIPPPRRFGGEASQSGRKALRDSFEEAYLNDGANYDCVGVFRLRVPPPVDE
jgi:hypothetical protein